MGAVDFVVHVWVGVVEGPDDLFVRRDPDENPVPPGADEGIAVDHSLGAAKAVGKEVLRQHELPSKVSRTIWFPAWRFIVFSRIIVDGRGELITTGKISSRSVVAVGEDENVSCMGKTGFNPADLVLEIQFLIRSSSSIIRLRISPAIEEIAAVAICSSSVACGFFCGGAVIYNPDFVTVMGTE